VVKRVAHLAAVLIVALGLGTGAAGLSEPQAPTGDERTMLRAMLKAGYESVRDHYFDRTFNGVSWDARYAQYQARLATAPTLHEGLLTVADMVDGLGDSHTRFYPAGWLHHVDYGYDLVAIGARLHVGAVRPSTDAATKLRPGDLVTALNAQPITRQSLPRTRYVLSALTPLAETRLTLRDPDGRERNVDVKSTVTESREMRLLGGAIKTSDYVRAEQEAEFAFRARSASIGNVLIWKMPRFISDLGDINRVADVALKHQAVVLDLRGNPGGYVDALLRLTSVLFSGDITVGTQVERHGPTALKVRPRRNRTFDGRLVVLIDSESASSSEVIARIVQLEGRGTVLGDTSAGAVRIAVIHPFMYGFDSQTPYAFSVTTADLLMRDGSSLEGRGVTPDELVLPTADDLAQGRDPVLSRAVAILGGALDPAAAGKLFR